MLLTSNRRNLKSAIGFGVVSCLILTSVPGATVLMYTGQGAGNGFDIVNVANPANTPTLATVSTPGGVNSICVVSNRAFLCDSYQGVRILDISTRTNPTSIGSLSLDGGFAYDLAVQGNYIYAANGANGLRVVDMSNPASMNIVATVPTHDPAGGACSVRSRGAYAYVADARAGLLVVDISTPTQPVEVARMPVTGGANPLYHRVDLFGPNRVCVTSGSDGILEVVDVSDPAHPTSIGSVSGRQMHYLRVVGQYAYVAGWDSGGMQVVDLSTPTKPVIVGSWVASGEASDIFVAGGYAYIANHNAAVTIVDVSDPAHPVRVGEHASPQTWAGLFVFDDSVTTGISMIPMLTIDCPAGSPIQIQYRNALGSGSPWLMLTNVVTASSPFLFPDTTAQGQGQRFYRVLPQ